MEELRKVQREYGAAFAYALNVAKQCGFDFRTAERLLFALTSDRRAALPPDVDQMQAALQRAASAFQQMIDAVHKLGVTALA